MIRHGKPLVHLLALMPLALTKSSTVGRRCRRDDPSALTGTNPSWHSFCGGLAHNYHYVNLQRNVLLSRVLRHYLWRSTSKIPRMIHPRGRGKKCTVTGRRDHSAIDGDVCRGVCKPDSRTGPLSGPRYAPRLAVTPHPRPAGVFVSVPLPAGSFILQVHTCVL